MSKECKGYIHSLCCGALMEKAEEGEICSACRKPNPMSECEECTDQENCIILISGAAKVRKSEFEEKWGDLIKEAHNYDAIVHGCNCFNTMGGGIAYGISKCFPEAAEKDKKTIYGDINKLGNIDVIEIDRVEVRVANAYTQFQPGRDVSYAAIEMCLRKINYRFKGYHIAMPMIGCGIAGGDWTKVKQMIKDILVDIDVTIIYWDGEKEKFNNEFPK